LKLSCSFLPCIAVVRRGTVPITAVRPDRNATADHSVLDPVLAYDLAIIFHPNPTMSDSIQGTGTFTLPSDIDIKSPFDIKLNADPSPPPSTATTPPPLQGKQTPFRFVATWQFWGILILGQILSWCIVSTNTLTEYLALAGANIPAFQTVFNYALLNLVYTSYTIYRYGFKRWARLLWKDGWKYFILGFADVQGV